MVGEPKPRYLRRSFTSHGYLHIKITLAKRMCGMGSSVPVTVIVPKVYVVVVLNLQDDVYLFTLPR